MKGVYTIVSFLSPTNVILYDRNGKQLPRSLYINNIKKYKIDKYMVHQKISQIVLKIQKKLSRIMRVYLCPISECVVDDDVEDQIRPPHDDGGVDDEIERATQEQPLLDKNEESSDNRDNSVDGGGVVDLPFSGLDDKSLRDTMEYIKDTAQIQDQPII